VKRRSYNEFKEQICKLGD